MQGECGPRGTECRVRECVRGVPGVGCKTVAVAVVAVVGRKIMVVGR